MVQSQLTGEVGRIAGFVSVEASGVVEDDDAADLKSALAGMAVNMESCRVAGAALGCGLKFRQAKLGVSTLSLGNPTQTVKDGSKDKGLKKTVIENVAASTTAALDPVFEYIALSESTPQGELAAAFMGSMARKAGLEGAAAVVSSNPLAEKEEEMLRIQALRVNDAVDTGEDNPQANSRWNIFKWMFGSSDVSARAQGQRSRSVDGGYKMAVSDFDLLKVVGKGAFGKVSAVRCRAVLWDL